MSSEEKKDLYTNPVYTLGSADPRCFALSANPPPRYSSFSATDIKVYIEVEGEEPFCLAELQSIECREDFRHDIIEGDMVAILFDRDALRKYKGQEFNLRLKAQNEYGATAECLFTDVQLRSSYWKVAIEDIVIENHYTFTAETCSGFEKIR